MDKKGMEMKVAAGILLTAAIMLLVYIIISKATGQSIGILDKLFSFF